MRRALGHDAERVGFVDLSTTYTRPARALAAYYALFAAELRDAPAVRAVAEFQLGPTVGDWLPWQAYEAATNLAYAHLPVWVMCTYDAGALPEPVLDGVLRTHPEVLAGDFVPSDRYADPREELRRLTPPPEPLDGLRSWSAGPDLETFRERLARELAAGDVPTPKALEALVAANEIAANAVRHGGGIEEVRSGRVDGRFVCEVIDRGPGFDDPLAGYLSPPRSGGAGLWVARRLAWRLEAFHAARGFTVRLWL
jgi:anti-sigma regulatory factor (Ser/Thr protein kinase)